MVVTESGTVTVGGRELPVLVINLLVINLLEPDSDQSPAARAMLEDFLAAGMAAMLLHGPDMRIVYDQTRYAAISPDDIEAAFRYERSQDAEELRRLRAVGEGFRSLTRPEAEWSQPDS